MPPASTPAHTADPHPRAAPSGSTRSAAAHALDPAARVSIFAAHAQRRSHRRLGRALRNRVQGPLCARARRRAARRLAVRPDARAARLRAGQPLVDTSPVRPACAVSARGHIAGRGTDAICIGYLSTELGHGLVDLVQVRALRGWSSTPDAEPRQKTLLVLGFDEVDDERALGVRVDVGHAGRPTVAVARRRADLLLLGGVIGDEEVGRRRRRRLQPLLRQLVLQRRAHLLLADRLRRLRRLEPAVGVVLRQVRARRDVRVRRDARAGRRRQHSAADEHPSNVALDSPPLAAKISARASRTIRVQTDPRRALDRRLQPRQRVARRGRHGEMDLDRRAVGRAARCRGRADAADRHRPQGRAGAPSHEQLRLVLAQLPRRERHRRRAGPEERRSCRS